MRIFLVVVLAAFLTGCGGTQLYSHQDMSQVRSVYSQVLPTYVAFEQAYKADDTARILSNYAAEQTECKRADVIDTRDTIDPNINLFSVSATLDGLCNTIESAYAWWAKTHHRPFIKGLIPSTPETLFIGMTSAIEHLPLQLAHPDVQT